MQARPSSAPQSIGSIACDICCHIMKPSPIGSPAGSAVLPITTRSNQSGFSAIIRSPSSPPQSWTNTWKPSVGPIETADELGQPGDVVGVGVRRAIGRLVGAAEPDQVGRDDPIAGVDERRDHAAVQVAPGRLAVQQQERARLAGSLLDVRHAQPVDLDVLRLVREIGQLRESVVGRADVRDGHRAGLISSIMS